MALTLAPGAFASACDKPSDEPPSSPSNASAQPSGCTKDTDCKGDRVCTEGVCRAPDADASKSAAPATSSAVTAAPPTDCLPCQTQEDFDKVQKKGARCCPVIACTEDADCVGGRVCCKIPDGQLCGDESRCKGVNRVETSNTRPIKKSIACGSETCSAVCCAWHDRCAPDRNSCPRATNGEGAVYECDGPEDCAGGEVCCHFQMDRTEAQSCMAAAKCTGGYQHPRYGGYFPNYPVPRSR